MKFARILTLLSILLLSITVIVGCSSNDTTALETDTANETDAASENDAQAEVVPLSTLPYFEKFVGHQQCADCHEDQMQKWETSNHTLKTTFGPNMGGGHLLYDFAADMWDELDTYLVLDQKDSNTIYVSTRKFALDEVDITVGSVYQQRYAVYYDGSPMEAFLATTEDGGISWNLDKSQVVQFEGNKERAGYNFLFVELRPNQDVFTYGVSRSIQETCIACHSTGFNPDAWYEAQDEFLRGERDDLRDLFVSELSISCEACHGPGLDHVNAPEDPGRIVNPAKLDRGEPEIRKAVCEQCHTRPSGNLLYPKGSDSRGFQVGVHTYFDVMQHSRPAWGEGSRGYSIDGKGRRTRQQDTDLRLHDFLQGGNSVMGNLACFDCHDAMNVGNNPENRVSKLDKPIDNCAMCHGDDAADLMKSMDGREGFDSYGPGNWGNDGGNRGPRQHVFNFDDQGRAYGLTPDQYTWALKEDGDRTDRDGWFAIWPFEVEMFEGRGHEIFTGEKPWEQ